MFQEQRIAITGAGSGLGRAISLEFGSRGWKVAASDIDLEAAKETVDRVTKLGGHGIAVKCDVTRIEDIESLAREVACKWDGIDVLVNNAGIFAMGDMEDHSLKDCELLIDINVLGVIRMCKVFIPIMREQGGGHIVNIGSAAGFAAPPGESIYNTSKAGVLALSETLRYELSPRTLASRWCCLIGSAPIFSAQCGRPTRGCDKLPSKRRTKSKSALKISLVTYIGRFIKTAFM